MCEPVDGAHHSMWACIRLMRDTVHGGCNRTSDEARHVGMKHDLAGGGPRNKGGPRFRQHTLCYRAMLRCKQQGHARQKSSQLAAEPAAPTSSCVMSVSLDPAYALAIMSSRAGSSLPLAASSSIFLSAASRLST